MIRLTFFTILLLLLTACILLAAFMTIALLTKRKPHQGFPITPDRNAP